RGIRLYRLDSVTGEHQAFTPEGIDFMEFHVLPDGRSVAAINSDQEHRTYSLDGADSAAIPHLARNDRIVRWLPDANAGLGYRTNELPARLYRVDLDSGERSVWRDLAAPDPTGMVRGGRGGM